MAVLELKFACLLLPLIMMHRDVQGVSINDTRLGAANYADVILGSPIVGLMTGIVEVFVVQYDRWLPVCSTTWDNSAESKVLCQQLGFNETRTPATDRTSLPSNRLSLDFDFKCSGAESELQECFYQFLNEHLSCYPIIVSCTPCTEGSVQLYNGTFPEEGIVEYCRGGLWRAVCDINWSYQNSFVVCRQLGLPATATVPHMSMYHPFPLGVYFNCFGNESSLKDCHATGTLLCNSENTAGVQCTGDEVAGFPRCTDGDVRLIGGRQNEGRVEICSNGVWGTVYDGGSWDNHDAIIICRQLGYLRAIPYRGGLLGNGSGPILFAYLNCIGNEASLSECETSQSIPFGTGHFNDAGVRCLNTTSNSNCSDGDVRLLNGTTMFEGRVEICYDRMWGSVCDNLWDNTDAAIVCRQLGFQEENVKAVNGSYFGDTEGPYLVSNTYCRSGVRNLLSCSQRGVHDYTSVCSPGHEAGVICVPCNHGDVRLKYGYAEVCVNGTWAAICIDADMNATAVAKTFCKQLLGVGQSIHAETCSRTRTNRAIIATVLDDVSCSEQSRYVVHDCSFNVSQSTAKCSSVLSLGCFPHSNCTEGAVRLVGGRGSLEGRVEVCVDGFWGVLREQTELYVAEKICRQLKLPWEWALPYSFPGKYHQVSYCFRGEDHCYKPSCYQGSALGVKCQGDSSKPKECEHLDVRLVNGSKKTEGRLEICAYGYWSAVCIDHGYFSGYSAWNSNAAKLVCRKLGFSTEVALHSLYGAPFGTGPSTLPVVGINCGFVYPSSNGHNQDASSDIDGCSIANQSTACPTEDIIGISCGERQYSYKITMELLPAQESYEIGTQVTLRCILPPSLQKFPLKTIRWGTTVPAVRFGYDPSRSNTSFVIPAHHPTSANYYCFVNGEDHYYYDGGTILGTGRITLKIKAVLQRSISKEYIHAQQQGSIQLQVETLNIDVARSLSELTWYHNGSVILPSRDERITFSNNNKTLLINNFSSADAGVYKAQFNRIDVQPYNQNCNDKLVSLLRSYPTLAPAVYHVNVNSSTNDDLQVRRVNVQQLNFDLSDGLSLLADGISSSCEEFEHLSLRWYRNGGYFRSLYSVVKRQYPTISQELEIVDSEVVYKNTGRYEVALVINLVQYLGESESICRASYSQLQVLAPYAIYKELPLSWGFIDVNYHKDFYLDIDKQATTKNDGVTLTCQASIQFPPFSMLSLIKNKQIVATSSNGLLQINTKSVNANHFGLYTCQLNASGVIFEKSTFLREQVNIRLMITTDNLRICGYLTESFEAALFSKISMECQCSFSRDDFGDSSIDCQENELTYKSTIKYSNDDGSETASVITSRLDSQVPFPLIVEGMAVTVVTVNSTSCTNPIQSTTLSRAATSGLFIGGVATGALIVFIMAIIIIGIKKCHQPRVKDESKPGDNDKTSDECTHAAENVPTSGENDN